MLRKKLFEPFTHETFRHHNREILRIEALSDAVLAFSVSLLVASLEVPQTFHEFRIILLGAIPFAATVAMLFLFWYQQYLFFRHYAINDFIIILLNLAYLAVILFYIYPLKFLFSLLLSSWTGIDFFPLASEKGLPVLEASDFPMLVMLFSAGYFLIWLLISLMHLHAYRLRKLLQLNEFETVYTRKEMRGALANAAIGLLATGLAYAHFTLAAGMLYLLIMPALLLNIWLMKRRLKKNHIRARPDQA